MGDWIGEYLNFEKSQKKNAVTSYNSQNNPSVSLLPSSTVSGGGGKISDVADTKKSDTNIVGYQRVGFRSVQIV